MPLLGSVIVPHPPVILPTVGRGREREIQNVTDAYRAAAQKVAQWAPDVLIVSSPHVVMYSDYFHIPSGGRTTGDMARFGAPQTKLNVAYDIDLRREIIAEAEAAGIRAGTLGERDAKLDHGTFIPLYFLREAGVDVPIVRIGLSGFSPFVHYRLGQCVARSIEKLDRRAVYVASGDLSHKLQPDGPYGFAPEGPVFDREITEAMKSADFLRFLTLDPSMCERAAECGLRSFQMMAGALDGLAVKPDFLVHEDKFGVGYGIATFEVAGRDESRCYAEQYENAERERLAKKKASEDEWVRLARMSLETYVRTGKPLERLPDGLPDALTNAQAGAFVSLHVRDSLRGCIGTTAPTTDSVAWEIIQNAVSAGTRDPRFPPVRPDELDKLEYSVDVLGTPEPATAAELDAKRYGVIVSCGTRRGLLLPDLDGVDSVEEQIDIARRKGNIGTQERYALQRFEVVRHT
ncbi:MAG: AmmeMemoRadiSam system protein A [Oscillibacter sp.]|nr:AmmeMemoRadiSam system protein A [Oscillibacter sp.]